MDESTATWESASVVTPPPEPPAAPAAEPLASAPDTATPPAEPTTLEKPADVALEAQPEATRESVSEPVTPEPVKEAKPPEVEDKDVLEGDTPEILALPSGSSARQWARRQFHDAKPIHDYQDFDTPISAFVDDLNKRSPSRFREMMDDLATGFSDYLSQRLADVKGRLQGAQPESTTEEMPAELPATDNEAKLADENKTLKTQLDDLTKRLDAVTGEITSQKQAGRQQEISTKQQELYTNVWSVVDEGIRNLGLEPQPTDPPKIASLKKAATRLLDRHHIESAFDAVSENQKLVKHVFEATNRGEFENAFREMDNLRVRARAAFASVTEGEEFKAIMEEIEAYANQSKQTSRAANPIPPAPGSSVGVTIKPPTTWDEAERPSAA